jgi:multidrug resistance efflux pump
MQQFLLALLLVLGGLSYYLWNENGILKANNAKLEVAIQTQEEAIATLQSDFALQSTQLNEMTVKSQQAQRELNRYSEFIRNYELSAKIMGDPVEMQRKINNGTKHIMEDIEELSVIVDDLDDGLQLQPTSD